MTTKERINTAIAARSQTTPGEWTIRKRVDNSGDYPFPDYDILAVAEWGPQGVAEAHQNPFNAALIAAAPDLVDEVVKLRKWQREAMPWLSYASDRYWEKNHHHDGVGRNNDLDRLIAEAEGEQNA